MVWAAALSAGSSLIGGLLGMNSQRKAERRAHAYAMEQRAYHEQREADQFVRLRDAAEKAGFNPASVLRSGGAAGFQQDYSPSLSFASHAWSIQGMMDGVGSAFQAAFDYDPMQERRATLELDIMQAQLERIQSGAGRAGFLEAPSATGSTQETDGFGNTEYDPGRRTQTWYAPPASSWEVHPARPDAEVVETSLGEPAAFLYSPVAAGLDIGHNLRRARDYVRGRWAAANGGNNRSQWVAPRGQRVSARPLTTRLDTFTGW